MGIVLKWLHIYQKQTPIKILLNCFYGNGKINTRERWKNITNKTTKKSVQK